MNGIREVYTLKNYTKWQTLFNSKNWLGKDVYFEPAWYQTWEESGYGEAYCIYYAIEDIEFLYTFLYHQINGYNLLETYYDVETAYGLGGVLVSKEPSLWSIEKFNKSVDEWMNDHRVVAEFIRLHPDLNNIKVRNAEYIPVRTDVYLDLAEYTEERIWKEILSGKTRNMIRKGQREGMLLSYDKNLDDTLDYFIKVYLESYKRLNMRPFYMFSDAYFNAFKKYLKDIAFQIDVNRHGELTASSLWLQYGDTLHYYLAATADKFITLPRSDTYLWDIIVQALKMPTVKTIHWGGGMSLDPNDTLFKFKSKYANRSETIYIGKKINNPSVYLLLCEQWEKCYPNLVNIHGRKLLKYREITT